MLLFICSPYPLQRWCPNFPLEHLPRLEWEALKYSDTKFTPNAFTVTFFFFFFQKSLIKTYLVSTFNPANQSGWDSRVHMTYFCFATPQHHPAISARTQLGRNKGSKLMQRQDEIQLVLVLS